jgi:hypothetical protein
MLHSSIKGGKRGEDPPCQGGHRGSGAAPPKKQIGGFLRPFLGGFSAHGFH